MSRGCAESCPPPVMGGPSRAAPPGPSRRPDASTAGALVPCRRHGAALSPGGHLEGSGLWLRARGQAPDLPPSHTRRGASHQGYPRQLRDEPRGFRRDVVPGQGKAGKQADGGGRGSGLRLAPQLPLFLLTCPQPICPSIHSGLPPGGRGGPWGTRAGYSHSASLALQQAKVSALESGSQTRSQACVCPARPAPAPTERSVNARGPSRS